jgi:inner membrane protein involved in colicin E2 resistance
MAKRLAAVIVIFFCTSIAWVILGSTIFARTYSLNPQLKSKVASSWGAAQIQGPPAATFQEPFTRKVTDVEGGKRVEKTVEESRTVSLPLGASDIHVKFELEPRQKGLLWYRTYRVQFQGEYRFTNFTDKEQRVTFRLPYPAEDATYDDLRMTLDGTSLAASSDGKASYSTVPVPAGKTVLLGASYRSNGLDRWTYQLNNGVSQVPDFTLTMITNFKGIDFPEKTLSPTSKQEIDGGWQLTWQYRNLVTGYNIGMEMPEKLQPGPLAGEISYFAPVSLLFFFFVMLVITTIKGIPLHPMNYFFLACAFFAFHLLLAYLVDHISIHLAFVIASVTSVFLLVSYLRLVVGMRFAAVEAGLAQFVYLVLFSYAFFFTGFTGLAITIGAIITLFIAMQLTGRVNWSEKFAALAPGTSTR